MHPKVRDLYKRVLLVGRDYPKGLDWVRERAKAWFKENAHLESEKEIRLAVGRGRAFIRDEMMVAVQFRKYRVMRARYKVPEEQSLAANKDTSK
mmetsp:Transcript_46267/g.108961  ORF Transcript_46267/g.108961 Transcript_46267/m.108961 type:complete len:94 (+) Transcript_46267:20-301(+)